MAYTSRVREQLLEVYDKGEKDGEFECGKCRKEISGQIYYCHIRDCCFHEACANLPLKIKHFFHPCFLYLYISRDFTCDFSYVNGRDNYIYKCNKCNFIMDVECATQVPSIGGDKEQILHCCHRHPLQPLALQPEFLLHCRICNELCLLIPTWSCDRCSFFVHKSCLDFLPEVIKTKHPFQVASWILREKDESTRCFDCDRENDRQGLVFRRAGQKTNYYLCISCGLVRRLVQEDPSIQYLTVMNHFFHPCCLELVFSPYKTCNACFQNHDYFFYHCSYCNFFLDYHCAHLPKVSHDTDGNQIRHFSHWHPLTLLMSTEGVHTRCSLCEEFFSESIYGCQQCQFYIHRSCMNLLPQITKHRLLNQTIVSLPVPSFECTTCTRKRSGLAFYCDEDKSMFCVKCTLWRTENERWDGGRFISIHHWHQLTVGEIDIDKAWCFMCGQNCSGWAYDCKECGLYFHKSCAELPKELQHPSHPHPLTLTDHIFYYSDATEEKKCNFCLKSLSQGSYSRFYQCESCSFFLDIRCVPCLPSIEYQGHPHLLHVVGSFHDKAASCDLCNKGFPLDFPLLRCPECNFNLHLLCGPLPQVINHACHVHPLALQDYYVEDNASDEFACHICEEHRDPLERVYRCVDDCFMICELKCVLPEVVASLQGKHGEVELETMYPKVPCKVITKDSVLKGIKCATARDNDETATKNIYVFSFDELVRLADSNSEFKDEENFGIEALEEHMQNHQQNEEKTSNGETKDLTSKNLVLAHKIKMARYNKMPAPREKERKIKERTRLLEKTRVALMIQKSAKDFIAFESYSYSRDDLMRFIGKLHRDDYAVEGEIWHQHDGSGIWGTYALPITLNSASDDFFEKYNVFSPGCRLVYRHKRYIMFIVYMILDEMHMEKLVNVKNKRISRWLNTLKHLQEKYGGEGLELDFFIEHVLRIGKAHFMVEAVDRVRTRASELSKKQEELSALEEELTRKLKETRMQLQQNKEEIEKHRAYRAVGARELKKEYYDSLEIKWRPCYEPSADYRTRP